MVIGLLVVVGAIAAVVSATIAKQRGGAVFGGGGIELAKLDGLDLAITPQALQAKLGGRLVDGALGSQVLASVARFLEDPAVALLLD